MVANSVLPFTVRNNIVDFLPKCVIYVYVENSDPMMTLIRHLIFEKPNAAFYEGRRFEIGGQNVIPGQIDPYVPPTVFPTDPCTVNFEHRVSYACIHAPPFRQRIMQHAVDYGIDNVIFKGQVHLHRGIGSDGYGNVGSHAVSYRSADMCELMLPVVDNWLLGAAFSLRELLDGHWMLHFVTGFFLQVTKARVGRTMNAKGVLHLDIDWSYGS